MKKIKWVIGISLVLFNCGGNTPKEVQEYLIDKENGLVQTIENEDFKIEVQYKPQDYLVGLENRDKKLSEEEFKEKVTEKEGLQYFNIKLISKTGKPVLKTKLENEGEEDLRLQYYIGAFEYDLYLADGNDTMPCALYHFERTYEALPFNNISVAFENKNHNKTDKTLLIADRALGFELIEFTFKKEDILNVPKIKNN